MKTLTSIFLALLVSFTQVVFGADVRPQILDDSAPLVQISEYAGKIFGSDCKCWSIREGSELSKAIGGVLAGFTISAVMASAETRTILKSMNKIDKTTKKVGKATPQPKQPNLNNTEMAEASWLTNEKQLDGYEPKLKDNYIKGEKPKNSPDPEKWVNEKGGNVWQDMDGTWFYQDIDENTVSYHEGYPDFVEAGFVRQQVNIETVPKHTTDFTNADNLAPLGPRLSVNAWHHHQKMITMQEINRVIHDRFKHRGGVSRKKKKGK